MVIKRNVAVIVRVEISRSHLGNGVSNSKYALKTQVKKPNIKIFS